jgi:hypothetical protein
MKFRIQRDFLGDIHYAWCSPVFDPSTLNRYARGALTPPSSDPKSIYNELAAAVRKGDEHASKITSQKAMLTGLAADLHNQGRLTQDQRDEIVAIVQGARFDDWRPLLYVIPCSPAIVARTTPVPRAKRASHEEEFVVADLRPTEFHMLEF